MRVTPSAAAPEQAEQAAERPWRQGEREQACQAGPPYLFLALQYHRLSWTPAATARSASPSERRGARWRSGPGVAGRAGP